MSNTVPLTRGTPTVQAVQHLYRCIGGLDQTGATPTERPLAVNSSGQIIVIIIPGPPGGDIATDADVAVGVGVTANLGALPTNPRTMFIQCTGAAAALVRIRKIGGVAGSGALLGFREVRVFTEGIARCEAENVGAVAATVGVQYETS